ncbi:peptidoglycan-binding domain-containing protein [Dapis sp. BLCC M172]|uniref:peptidoglycan-binding domain-containing protein n=1 Tax=Dapis sp. BLCC M172 TaxID=2975281 RepID=UPI003CE7F07A
MSTGTQATNARPTLALGSRGEDVAYLQRRLNFLISASLEVDGIFGPATEKAVKKFQESSGGLLDVDGIVGPLTWGELELIDI